MTICLVGYEKGRKIEEEQVAASAAFVRGRMNT